MLPISDLAPQTLEEWETLVNNTYLNDQERYNTAVAEARAKAVERWDAEEPARREAMMKQAAANIQAMVEDGPAGPQPLSEAKVSELMTQAAEEMNETLAKEKQEFVQQAESVVPPPKSRKDIEQLYGFYKSAIEQTAQLTAEPEPASALAPYDFIWTDGTQYWDVANACYLNPNGRAPIDHSRVVMLGANGVSSFEQNIRENIKLYSQTDPRIKLGPEVMDTEELFTRLREERSNRLAEYDQKIAQLDRLIRENPDYAEYTIKRMAWDAYATALCNLPSQAGAPWDGGGPETPWPDKPE